LSSKSAIGTTFNIFPKATNHLEDLLQQGDLEKAAKVQEAITRAVNFITDNGWQHFLFILKFNTPATKFHVKCVCCFRTAPVGACHEGGVESARRYRLGSHQRSPVLEIQRGADQRDAQRNQKHPV